MNISWIEKNTFHYSEFSDLSRLVDKKQRKNLKISLCLPKKSENFALFTDVE